MADIQKLILVGYTLTLVVIQLPLVLTRLALRRLLKTPEITVSEDFGRALIREPIGVPLSFIRLLFDLIPDYVSSQRFRAVAHELYRPISAPGFEGWWHTQGDPQQPTRAKDCDKVIYFMHGGAYILGSPKASLVQQLRMVELLRDENIKLAVLGLKYPLAPEAQWPAPLEAAVAGYRWLIEHEGVDPGNIILNGESAGGHLVVSLLYEINRLGLDKPGGAILMFPWLNLNNRSPSWVRNRDLDALSQAGLDKAVNLLLPGDLKTKHKDVMNHVQSAKDQSCKKILPQKTWVSVGSHDVFLDDIVQWVELTRKDGADVELDVLPGLCHGGLAAADVFRVKSYLALDPAGNAEGVMLGAEYLAKGLLSMLK